MPVVVIVDDRTTNLKILRRFAERLGPDVIVYTYDDAEQALSDMTGYAADLIVTDYVMPRMSGDEFIRQCRSEPATSDVPIIVVTAYEDKEFRYRALDTGASDFLLSPVDGREFCIRARNLLTIRAQHRALHSHAISLESELETAQRQHAEEIAHRERLLRRIVNTVPALIRAAPADQPATLINVCHRDFFGLSDHPGGSLAERAGRAYVDRHLRLDRRIIETGRPIADIEETVSDKGGNDRVLLTSKAPLATPDGKADQVVTVSLDITERKRGERALRESEQRFRTLVESSVLGIVIARDGRPLFANRTYANMFGFGHPDEVLGLDSLDGLYDPSELPRIKEFRDLRSRGKTAPVRYEFQGVRRDGSRLWAETQDQQIVWDGQPVVQSTVADITLRKTYERDLQRQIHYDELTDLPNRVLALDRLRSAVVGARRSKHKVGVLFIDLDRFKRVNDTLGHATGDELLRAAAERLSNCIRAEDTVARLGGDEFLVILPKLKSAADAEPVIHKILETFSLPFLLGPAEAYVTASIGVTISPDDSDEPNILIQNADAAMYRAKEQDRNTFHFFTPELNQRARERMQLESHLLHALSRNELQLYYQPIVDIRSGVVVGAEALLRWWNPTLGSVEPDRFIPLAEDTGLIVPIGRWVLETACRHLRDWSATGRPPLRISVNISTRQFRGTSLSSEMSDAISRNRIDPRCLELEITEGLLMDDLPQTRANLHALSMLPVRLSLDDFGTGYSGLRYLRDIPVDALKVDKSFVSDVSNPGGNATLVKTIIAMGHELGLEVIGEGIETQEQLDFLRRHGCDLAQGFLFSRPLPAEDFFRWLIDHPTALDPVQGAC